MNSGIEHRSDIDGLRGIAVLLVVAYHLFPTLMKGGFIGVDIFFVISGFLITRIIISDLNSNNFNIVKFYSRRICRIFPALIVVMLCIFVFGWFYLFDDEYSELGKHIASGASFTSNFVLSHEAGYFDTAAITKPMLHLWSLAIEEQFYIFWPIFLIFLKKINFNLLRIIIFLIVISLAINTHAFYQSKMSAFYGPMCRFWELLVGGALANIMLHHPNFSKKYQNSASIFGLALIIIGFGIASHAQTDDIFWPHVFLSTLGAFFLILAGNDALINQKILSHTPLIYCGLVSYSLYLWHWPLLACTHIIESGIVSNQLKFIILFFSFIFSHLTYIFIEKPARRSGLSKKELSYFLVLLMILMGEIGYICYKSYGFSRYDYRNSEQNKYTRQKYYKYLDKFDSKYLKKCNFYDVNQDRQGNPTKIPLNKIEEGCYTRDLNFSHSVFVWGDSHATHLYFGLELNLPKNWQIMQVASYGCNPSLEALNDSNTDYCTRSNWFAINAIKKAKPDVVVVAQNDQHDPAYMLKISEKLHQMGVSKVILMGPTPHWTTDLPRIVVRNFWENTPQRTSVGINQKVKANNEDMKHHFSTLGTDTIFVDLINFFCNRDGCLIYVGPDKRAGITSVDYGHLTPIASDYLAKNILVPLILR